MKNNFFFLKLWFLSFHNRDNVIERHGFWSRALVAISKKKKDIPFNDIVTLLGNGYRL